MRPHAIIHATATIGPLGLTGPLLTRLAKAYVGHDAEHPDQSQTGYIVWDSIDRIGGVGPWAGVPADGRPRMRLSTETEGLYARCGERLVPGDAALAVQIPLVTVG
jgi:hypothetical protein